MIRISLLFACFSLCLISSISAQSWQFFVPGAVHYYQDQKNPELHFPANVYAFTVDEIEGNAHYLNHTVPILKSGGGQLPCTMGDFYRPMRSMSEDEIDKKAREYFLNSHAYYKPFIYSGDTIFIGKEREAFFLPTARENQSWSFWSPHKQSRLYTFTCVGIGLKTFGGKTDSIRTFSLKINHEELKEKMILSKNHGLLSWDPDWLGYGGVRGYPLEWLGYKDSTVQFGTPMPKAEDYFYFPSPGDISVWKDEAQISVGEAGPNGGWIWKTIYTSAIVIDSVTYVEDRNGRFFVHSDRTFSIRRTDTAKVVTDTFYVARDLFHEITDIKPNPFFNALPGTMLSENPSNLDRFLSFEIKTIGGKTVIDAFPRPMAGNVEDTTTCDMFFPIACFMTEKQLYRPGIGLVHMSEDGPYAYSNDLIGGRRNGVKFGDFHHFNGRSDANQALAFSVIPNPVEDRVQISLPNASAGFEYRILNSLGQLVSDWNASNLSTLNTADLRTGIYLLQIRQGERIGTQRIVKQ